MQDNLLIKLEFVADDDDVTVYRLAGTEKLITLTQEQMGRITVVDGKETINFANDLIRFIASSLSEDRAPRRAPVAPAAQQVQRPQQAPAASPAAQQAPAKGPQQPSRPAPAAPPSGPETSGEPAGSSEEELLRELGLEEQKFDVELLPYRINDDAKRSPPTGEDMQKLITLYESDTINMSTKMEIVRRLADIPPRIRTPHKALFPQDLRTSIVSYILSKDGLNTGFTPAEEGAFLGESGADVNKTFGLKKTSRQGFVPPEFEDSGVHAQLQGRMAPRYRSVGSDETLVGRIKKPE